MKTNETILEIKQLHKSYENTPILENISLSITKGEVVVIIGPSGCGKSTLLRCINGLESIQQGEIFLEKVPIELASKQIHRVRQDIGMVFQSYDLFPHMTVLDNILLGPLKAQKRNKEEATREAKELLDRVGLLEKQKSYPRQLSGGQKQRVAIVRSLIMHPKVMLFDEVTAALDPEMVREVLDVMLELAREGSTMVIVTHELQFARAIADRVLFLDKGKIIEESEPEQFFEHPYTERARQFLDRFDFDSIQHGSNRKAAV